MKRLLLICLVILCVLPVASSTEDAASAIEFSMKEEDVEAIWGKPVNSIGIGNICWYVRNGHTLICAYDVNLSEWIEFDADGNRVDGNVPENETCLQVFFELMFWNEKEYYQKSLEEQRLTRIHDVGSGRFIPAKITSDGYIVFDNITPQVIYCLGSNTQTARNESRENIQKDFWGSFTSEKTYSYDKRFYAVQTVEGTRDTGRSILVTVYETATDNEVSHFSPARAMDFWGICWERDTYTIWTQSADIGTYGYEYQDGTWIRNEALKRPAYIISRYDDSYRNYPELWDTIYHSPKDEP